LRILVISKSPEYGEDLPYVMDSWESSDHWKWCQDWDRFLQNLLTAEVILLDDKFPELERVYNKIKEFDIPTVVLTDKVLKSPLYKEKGPRLFLFKWKSHFPKDLLKGINRMLTYKKRSLKNKNNFCSVPGELLLKTLDNPVSVYRKEGEQFKKLFLLKDQKEEDLFDQNKNYYIRWRDLRNILNTQKDSLIGGLSVHNLSRVTGSYLRHLGMDDNILPFLNKNINLIFKDEIWNQKIKQLYRNSAQHPGFMSEHNLVLAFLTNKVLLETPWNSKENRDSLIIASLFHDWALPEHLFAKIEGPVKIPSKNLNKKEQKEYLSHPQKAAAWIKNFENANQQIEDIILNHHERYDGQGFPNALNYQGLDPLSTLFNLCHKVVEESYSEGSQEGVKQLLLAMETDYTKGHFPTAIQAIKKTLSKIFIKIAA
jgi:hypothetical protein